MTTCTITQEQIDDVVELLVTSLHHMPAEEGPELVKDTNTAIHMLRDLQPNTQEPYAYEYGNSLWHAGNPRITSNERLGLKLFTHPAPHQLDALQDIAAFISVGGYNGATPEQLTQRIKDEFVRLIQQPSEPQQKPLTDEQIDAIDQSMCGEREFIVPFARAIEAAHNIKG